MKPLTSADLLNLNIDEVPALRKAFEDMATAMDRAVKGIKEFHQALLEYTAVRAERTVVKTVRVKRLDTRLLARRK